jgi:hypothetical protein
MMFIHFTFYISFTNHFFIVSVLMSRFIEFISILFLFACGISPYLLIKTFATLLMYGMTQFVTIALIITCGSIGISSIWFFFNIGYIKKQEVSSYWKYYISFNLGAALSAFFNFFVEYYYFHNEDWKIMFWLIVGLCHVGFTGFFIYRMVKDGKQGAGAGAMTTV